MIAVTLAYVGKRWQGEIGLCLASGATIADAIAAAASQLQSIGVDKHSGAQGVWGKARPLTYSLRDGDRVEVYELLIADPKMARRQRATHLGRATARSAPV